MIAIHEIIEPPHNKDVEQEVLGSVLLEPKLMESIIDRVKPTMFRQDLHKEIFKAMSYLHHNQIKIDYTNILDRLEYKKKVHDEDIVDYVLELADTVPSLANFENKVQILIDLAQKRNLYDLGLYFVTKDIKGVSTANLVKMTEDTMENVEIVSNQEYVSTKEYTKEWKDEALSDTPKDFISFGFKKLDEIIMLEKSDLGIFAARPGY